MTQTSSERQSAGATAFKWLGFVTAVWVQAISGNNYTFSNYSDSIKTLMNLTQVQLNNLSVAKDVGKAFGLLAGFASDAFPTWLLLLIGSLEGLIGYGTQWLVVSQKDPTLNLVATGSRISEPVPNPVQLDPAPSDAGKLVANAADVRSSLYGREQHNMDEHSCFSDMGPVSGILKGYIGLSTAIFTDLCNALFSSDPARFLAMLSLIPFAVCLIAMVLLHEVPPSSTASELAEETNYFNMFNILAVIVAVYLLAFDFVGSQGHVFDIMFSVILLALLAVPLTVPAYILFKGWIQSRPNKDNIEDQNNHEPLLCDQQAILPESEGQQDVAVVEAATSEELAMSAEIKKSKPVLGEEHTIFQILKTIDFWILFMSFLCGVGTGMMVMNNMGQMGSALGYTDVSIFVSLLSIMGFFGRIISGTVSEYFIKKTGTPRPVFNAASQILIAVGYVVMALAIPGCLYIGSTIVGFCYGVRLAITVPAASELFGLKYYGLVYNILILNLPLGSFLFSGLLAGLLYDAEAASTSSGGNECYGAHCYRTCFFVMAAACLLGCALDVVLSMRTRELYRKISASK
ncbi:hypothetical protein Cgig2_003143 [Carnegiea gigantea]|uniref:Nodulin-like domain-containing protein n=1 Tax=Carnegiea gigantea TaxID=171969 RepID=A0A9Q1GQ55_9CARY|nr:hypothetical protein Cgig2_003143 [Carnegiea gigantea]